MNYLRSAGTAPAGSSVASPASELHGRWLVLAQVGWLVATLTAVGLFVVAVPARYTQIVTLSNLPEGIHPDVLRTNLAEAGFSTGFYATYHLMMEGSFAIVCVMLGIMIFWRRSEERMALFVSLLLVLLGTTFWGTIQALTVVYPRWGSTFTILDTLSNVSLFVFFHLFPDGRFVPGWTRWLTVTMLAFATLSFLFPESPINPDNFPVPLFVLFMLVLLLTGVFAQTYRYRRVSGPVERQQTKWVVFGFAVALVGFLGVIFFGEFLFSLAGPGTVGEMLGSTAITLFMLLIPLSISVAILRYRLFDIDVLVNRTLVYSALTISVVGIYVLVVGYLGVLFQTSGSLLISLIATSVVAVLFQPLRERLQRAVNRLMYGERDEPYRVLSRLGQRLEATIAPDSVLPTIAATVREALKLPHASIVLKGDDAPVASSGKPVDDPLRLPLVYRNEPVGELLLGPRAGEESFSVADRRLLEDLARQTGVAAYAVRLTADLQRSRERLVTMREEERRRLRRDLHDGLGAQLAGLNIQTGVLRSLIPRDPAAADELVVEMREELRAAITDIRRLVYDLRPPALDDLGLVTALRRLAERYGAEGEGLRVLVEAPEDLTPLSAAVEVAVYRISQEALTNVVRHARAKTCVVRLSVTDEVRLEIADDGIGLPEEHTAGVGMLSMRERTEELGGTCIVEPASENGTRVLIRLPLSKE